MRFLSQVGVGLSHKSCRDESRISRCLPPSSPYQLCDTHKYPALHGVYLSAESLRQLALLQDRHINPDSIHKVTYSCSGGALFMAVYFGAGQFLAHTEINTAGCLCVCVCEHHSISSPPERFYMWLPCSKKAPETNIPKSANWQGNG